MNSKRLVGTGHAVDDEAGRKARMASLFDTLNESKGYGYLIHLGCSDRRDRVHRGEIFVTSVPTNVTTGMLNKVSSTMVDAVEQLDHEDPDRTARRIVFTVLNFDDWVGDYQTEYIGQLDAHLAANPIEGAELVFCPASNLFERRFTMRSAAVVEI